MSCISDNRVENILLDSKDNSVEPSMDFVSGDLGVNNNNLNIEEETKDEEIENIEDNVSHQDSETDNGDEADEESDCSIDGDGESETDEENFSSKKKYSLEVLLTFQSYDEVPESMLKHKDQLIGIMKSSNSNFNAINNNYNNSNHKKNNKNKKGRYNHNNNNNNHNKNNMSAPNTPRKVNAQNPNAWQVPSRNTDSEEGKRNEFNRKVNGFLNKLTLENFESLSIKFLNLILDCKEFLNDVINSIFDKALGEPKFSMVYSKLCHSMYKNLDSNNPNVNDQNTNFRKLLVNKCQEQFNNKITDQEEITEEQYSKIKQRYLGNIKFIGELFLANLIPGEVVNLSSMSLLRGRDSDGPEEEDLEALCKLLSTTGKIFEQKMKPEKLDYIFKTLNHIRESAEISSRIKYMILDLEDLRRDSWVPRRKFEGPMKIADVHKEAKKMEEKASANRLNKSSSNIPIRSLNQSGDSHDNLKYNNNNNNNKGRGKVPQVQQQSPKQNNNNNQGWKIKSDSAINNNIVIIEEKPKAEVVLVVKPKQSFTSSFNTIVDEYFSCLDEIESKESLAELNADDSLNEFISSLISKTTKKDRILPAVKLLKYLVDENIITQDTIEKGFDLIFENIEETLEDFPNATSFYGEIIGNLFAFQISSLALPQKVLLTDLSQMETSKIVINFLKGALTKINVEELASNIKEANFPILSYAPENKLDNEADLKEVVSLLRN